MHNDVVIMDIHIENSNLRIRDRRLLEALNSPQEMQYGAHHHGYPVRLGCCVAPFLRLLECVGQGVVNDSVVLVGERNGSVR
jgi:hypothetical protein